MDYISREMQNDSSLLPVRRYTSDILQILKSNDIAVIIGETGSGKTTQLSQILLDGGYATDGIIAITQPRRVGAVSVAKRVAEERKCPLGSEVGYAVRFEDKSSSETKIKYLTDGTLLRECLEDITLSRYSVIILDEAHERSLNTDVLFGILKQLVKTRTSPLKLLITSATLDGEKFSAYFFDCPVFHVPGRVFPVEIIHATEDHLKDYVTASVDTALTIHRNEPPGDILVFLTGQAEIDKAVNRMNDAVSSLAEGEAGPLMVLPLYAALPLEMQVRVFRTVPDNVRRCIIATNVAETSITVEGVVYVIDSGVVKLKMYHPNSGMDSLDVTPISRVQAAQRAGRAGRTRPGKCFRLYSRKFMETTMPEVAPPEIQRTALSGVVLGLKVLDLPGLDVLTFDFLDPPAVAALEDALRQLFAIGAIDKDGGVTPEGRTMGRLPLEPSLARALIAAVDLGCIQEMMTVAAMLSAEHIWLGGSAPSDAPPRGQGGSGATPSRLREALKPLIAERRGDHVLLLRVWEAWDAGGQSKAAAESLGAELRGMNFARDIRKQLVGIIGEDGRRLKDGLKDEFGENNGRPVERENEPWRHDRYNPDASSSDRETRRREHASPAAVDAMVQALSIGFANKLARRLRSHNGYRTLNTAGQLAQPHPSCAALPNDEEGLLPEWIVYHELVSTSRPFLRQVCPTRHEWVESSLPRLTNVDVRRLSRGVMTGQPAGSHLPVSAAAAEKGPEACGSAKLAKRNDDASVAAAKLRYLQRKQAAKG